MVMQNRYRTGHPAFNDYLDKRMYSNRSTPITHWKCPTQYTVKPVFRGHRKRRPKFVFKTNYRLMQVKSIAECSPWSILQYFRPSLSYHLSLRSLICLLKTGLAVYLQKSLILRENKNVSDGCKDRQMNEQCVCVWGGGVL